MEVNAFRILGIKVLLSSYGQRSAIKKNVLEAGRGLNLPTLDQFPNVNSTLTLCKNSEDEL